MRNDTSPQKNNILSVIIYFFIMQPSRSDEFFGCKAYLTVSGQLQAEALAR